MQRDKERGMLIGVAYGDAMGAPCEFSSIYCTGIIDEEWIHNRSNQYGFHVKHEKGQVTDDTEMTTACLRTLCEGYNYHAFVNSGTYSLGTNTQILYFCIFR
jgi:ADP-ribosylglycohydrolase